MLLPNRVMNGMQSNVLMTSGWRKLLSRVAGFLMFAFVLGFVLHRISVSFERSPRPAGFGRGVLQGALMPMSLPNLLVGNNLSIYAAQNTGLPYKLGYTLGVNGCGALFFGFFF